MENASKALIMAGGVLIGILIISIGVYIFSSYAKYSSNAYDQMETAQIEQFNNQFLKYYDITTQTKIQNGTGSVIKSYIDPETEEEYSKPTPILCTAHDVVSLANLAKQNNQNFQLENETRIY